MVLGSGLCGECYLEQAVLSIERHHGVRAGRQVDCMVREVPRADVRPPRCGRSSASSRGEGGGGGGLCEDTQRADQIRDKIR